MTGGLDFRSTRSREFVHHLPFRRGTSAHVGKQTLHFLRAKNAITGPFDGRADTVKQIGGKSLGFHAI